jgi:site-specific recombinase XerD
MRHTGITKLVQAGVDITTIQQISGHKSIAMVLPYVHVRRQHVDRGVQATGRGLPAPLENAR